MYYQQDIISKYLAFTPKERIIEIKRIKCYVNVEECPRFFLTGAIQFLAGAEMFDENEMLHIP